MKIVHHVNIFKKNYMIIIIEEVKKKGINKIQHPFIIIFKKPANELL